MRRLYVLLVLLALAPFFSLATGSVIFYRLFYVLGILVVASLAWSFANHYRLRVSVRRTHGQLQVGDTLESDVVLENPTIIPKLMLEVREFTAIPGEPARTVVNLRPYSTLRWKPTLVLRKRGVFPLGHLVITSSDVFGVLSRQKVLPASEEVVVYPATVDLPWFYIPQRGLLREGRARQPTHVVTPMASSVREYIQGDTFQHIHWPTTARKGRLMAKQFDSGIENRAWVILDLQKDVQAGQGLDTTEEYVVSAAASIISKFQREGWAVGMAGQGDQWYLLPPKDHPSAQKSLDLLARARAEGSVSLASLLTGSESFLPPPPFMLVVITPSTRGDWPPAVRSLQQRGALVNVVLVDPASFGGAEGASHIAQQLTKAGILTYLVRRGDNLATALDARSNAGLRRRPA